MGAWKSSYLRSITLILELQELLSSINHKYDMSCLISSFKFLFSLPLPLLDFEKLILSTLSWVHLYSSWCFQQSKSCFSHVILHGAVPTVSLMTSLLYTLLYDHKSTELSSSLQPSTFGLKFLDGVDIMSQYNKASRTTIWRVLPFSPHCVFLCMALWMYYSIYPIPP